MKLTRTFATACTTAAAAVLLSAGGAAADDDLISALNNPAVGAVCFPSGQVGSGNTFSGTQNINCAQSTDQTITNPTPPANGGVTGQEVVFSEETFLEPGQQGGATAECPAGKVVTGGGYDKDTELGLFYNGRYAFGSGWQVVGWNFTNRRVSLRAHAVCVDSAE